MHAILERIPGVVPAKSALAEARDRVLPVRDENADLYLTMTGIWVAVGAGADVATERWMEKAISTASPAELAVTAMVTLIPTGGAALFWRQGWRSRGETGEI